MIELRLARLHLRLCLRRSYAYGVLLNELAARPHASPWAEQLRSRGTDWHNVETAVCRGAYEYP